MKKLSMYVCAALIAASTIVSSCKKPVEGGDDDPGTTPTPTEKKCYITKIKEDGILSEQYVYNTNNRIETVNTYDHEGTAIVEKFKVTYDGSGRVTRVDFYVEADIKEYMTFDYASGNNPSKMHFFTDTDGDGTLEEFIEIRNTYNSSNQNTRADLYTIENGEPTHFGYNEYTYTNGNLVKDIEYTVGQTGTPEVLSTSEYQYDTKKNPYSVISFLPTWFGGPMVSTNNITKATYKDEAGTVTGTDTYTYVYAANNYPSKITVTSVSGGSTTTETSDVEYMCN